MEPPLAITGYELSLFVHIIAAVVGFGASFAESVMFPVAMKLDRRHLPYVHRLQLTINQFFVNTALVVVLATGIYQTIEREAGFGDFWISASMLIVLVIGGLNGAYFIPEDRRLGPIVQREIDSAQGREVSLSQEYQRRARRESMAGAITGVLLIVAIFLMVTKPGA